jgi:fatty acid/phospholipid biosynthesis enzyme
MNEKPSQVFRHARGTSMWSALDSVREPRGAGGDFLRQYRRR